MERWPLQYPSWQVLNCDRPMERAASVMGQSIYHPAGAVSSAHDGFGPLRALLSASLCGTSPERGGLCVSADHLECGLHDWTVRVGAAWKNRIRVRAKECCPFVAARV